MTVFRAASAFPPERETLPSVSRLLTDNWAPLLAFAVCAVGVSLGWELFAGRLEARTTRAMGAASDVAHIWGGPLLQPQPQVRWRRADADTPELSAGELSRTDVQIALDAQYRRRGIIEFPGYLADFDGSYRFKNPAGDTASHVGFTVGLPVQKDALMLSDLKLLVDGVEDAGHTEYTPERIAWTGRIPRDAEVTFQLHYRARGLERFGYTFNRLGVPGDGVRPVTAFKLAMTVRGARGAIDFPVGAMAPTAQGPVEGGELLVWDVERLLTSFDVGVVLPDSRGVATALGKLIDNAPFFFLLYGAGLLYALSGVRKKARALHVLGLSGAYFLYFPLATYLTAYLPWPVASSVALLGISLLAVLHAWRFITVRAALLVTLCQLFFLAVPAAAYLVPAHTGLILVLAAFLALGAGLQILGNAALRVREDDEEVPLASPVIAQPIGSVP